MPKLSQDVYDVVIIGAGISGLVCGCYLAKAGRKVLIVEQHHKPGGYCTSFKRKGFTFDAAAHSFGGYRNGPLGTIFRELQIDKKIKIHQFDPSDIVITSDFELAFFRDLDKTIKTFQSAFPNEANAIHSFFHFLHNPDANFFAKSRSWTFQDLMNKYFVDWRLMSILSFPLLGNGGVHPSKMTAFIGAKMFREFLLDGGYYPEGGMQMLPDALAQIFREHGGEMLLSTMVKKIRIREGKAVGVVAEKLGFLPSKTVISNSDARQTFLCMIGKRNLDSEALSSIRSMEPSLSVFVLYVGMDEYHGKLPEPGINHWYLKTYDMNEIYSSIKRGDIISKGYMVHVMPDRRTILAFRNASYRTASYWKRNKEKIAEAFHEQIEEEAIPNIRQYTLYKDAATPATLQRYTLNYRGAAFGWSSLPAQFAIPFFRKPSSIKNLYLTGHWTTLGLGIPGVVYIGYDTAKMVLRQISRSS